MSVLMTVTAFVVTLAMRSMGVCGSSAHTVDMHPIKKVLPLILKLKSDVEKDGQNELKSYDKHQCWCEETLERKAKNIADGKTTIGSLSKLIPKLGEEIAQHGAEINQLKKDIAANEASKKEAASIREQEFAKFNAGKAENEQCIGALESAIGVLTGAGAGKKKKDGFLQELPAAQLKNIAANVRWVLQKNIIWRTSEEDLNAIRSFVSNPEGLVGAKRKGGFNGAQLDNNPFGDYAPQSTQIQGILKGMYDAFTADLEKDNAEEAEKQKAFEEFEKTKNAELSTFKLTLQKHVDQQAKKSKQRADRTTDDDETKDQVAADEVFFEDTKKSCETTAQVFAERVRLRTEELQGIITAIEILQKADGTFKKATATLLQLKVSHRIQINAPKHAYMKIRNLAAKYHNVGLAQLAVQMKTGGQFEKVILMIDRMIELIRKEEVDDIAHRDRCQNAEGKNGNDIEDIKTAKAQTKKKLARLSDNVKSTKSSIKELEKAMKETKKSMKERLAIRNKEHDDFEKALKVDQEAIDALRYAIAALTKFYKQNGIPLTLAQAEPKYTEDPDKAPKLEWAGEDSYEGRKEESRNIIEYLAMILEDYAKEMKTGRQDEATAQQEFEADRQAMQDVLHAQEESHATKETELAELQDEIQNAKSFLSQKESELEEQGKLKTTLKKDCKWVDTHFKSRRKKRRDELDGLAEAKNIIGAGGNADEFVLER
eukprot:CAMPEP_0172659940 /NCGR_PEP_ID=MMETSP1074-20121228/3789_1 /TAXON_ID=2916 /ORGANISM="Ceratium fusus, Strain PA161109" /LENGTH=713 /DNA_ID=CAMNT_0013475523 /DNA_START=63 /DNA_END=2204 /DNA_ORIENTATION=-